MIWVELLACAALITWAGSLLWKYGHLIAEKTGLGGAGIGAIASMGDRVASTSGLAPGFVGNLFMALTTSLPEITASLGAIDLAIGNVPGSKRRPNEY